MIALVLSGGGARAAYQAGFLRGIAEILPPGADTPFRILSGTSAGAINSCHLASHLHRGFPEATRRLWDLWSGLAMEKVFQTGGFSLTRLGMMWLTKLAFGGSFGTNRVNSLLDTSPLRSLLENECDFDAIEAAIDSGILHGLSFTATNYQTGTAVCFFSSHDPKVEEWYRSDRIGIRRRKLTVDHVMASSAIPVFFPPIQLDGFHFGDGCVRQTTPLSPPIHLGATKILAIGTRAPRSVARARAMNRAREENKQVEFAQIGGTLLNAVFLDSIERDAERLERINRTLSLIPPDARSAHATELREIPFQLVRPSQDLGRLARGTELNLPATLGHMVRGLGAKGRSGGDLMSYLAFDSKYTLKLLEIGRQDAIRRKDTLLGLICP